MGPWLSCGLALVILTGACRASAEELVGSTSCADYLRMQADDTQAGADQGIARRHVTSLMREYSKYILRDANGRPLPTIVEFIISFSTHYCQRHPTSTVTDAGEAIGAAEQQAIAKSRQKQN